MLYRACCLPYLLPAYCLPAPATACLPTACYCCLAPACRLLLRLLPVPLLPLLLLAPLLLPTCCNATANTAADTANVADAAAADLRCRRCCHDIFFFSHTLTKGATTCQLLFWSCWMSGAIQIGCHLDWMPEAIQIGCQRPCRLDARAILSLAWKSLRNCANKSSTRTHMPKRRHRL